jgi:hypothetical protein
MPCNPETLNYRDLTVGWACHGKWEDAQQLPLKTFQAWFQEMSSVSSVLGWFNDTLNWLIFKLTLPLHGRTKENNGKLKFRPRMNWLIGYLSALFTPAWVLQCPQVGRLWTMDWNGQVARNIAEGTLLAFSAGSGQRRIERKPSRIWNWVARTIFGVGGSAYRKIVLERLTKPWKPSRLSPEFGLRYRCMNHLPLEEANITANIESCD